MTRTAPPSTSRAAATLTPLQAAAAEYIARRGIYAFMDEDYNLAGTRARAVVREENAELARAMGVPLAGRELPVAIDKREVWVAVDGPRRDTNRAELAEFFADPRNAPGIGFGQRLYLEWHYRSPNNYQMTLEKPMAGGQGPPSVVRLLGWNRETEVVGPGDFTFFTGLLGCTGVCAVAADGAAFMSHWDEICNPRQVEGYARFAAAHPGGCVRIVGFLARELGAAMRKRHPGLEILCHTKPIFFETTYTVRFSRTAGRVEVAFHEADVSDDYIASCHHSKYGRWFTYGRFGQACPGKDEEFRPCRFEPAGDDAGPPRVVRRAPADSDGLGSADRRVSMCAPRALADELPVPPDSRTLDRVAAAVQHAGVASFNVHQWRRDPANPILPPGGGAFDVGCCMNPFVLRRGDEYWLYYAGADGEGRRRICLAIAAVDDLTRWRRLGPLFELGAADAFDAHWCVLPCIHRFGSTWHLYYTGFNPSSGQGLQAFRGIGLATSTDLLNWWKHSVQPVLTGEGFPQWPDNHGMAGAGTVVELPAGPGEQGPTYRMYYTLSTGSPDPGHSIFVEQAKQSVCAHSRDGITWSDKRVMLTPRRDCDYENVGVIGLFAWRTGERYRTLYSAIGTRFGMYSICEAVSTDGLVWDRGAPGENLSLAPGGEGWEKEMVEYPCVVPEGDHLRLFYCGNGFGATGIGTAVAERAE